MANNPPGNPIHPATGRRVATQPDPGGARSECYTTTATAPRWGQIKGEQWGHFRVLRPALAQPARRRVRGIAAQSIFTALLLTAANIRKIRAWRELTPDEKKPIARRARRRRTSLRDYLPDG